MCVNRWSRVLCCSGASFACLQASRIAALQIDFIVEPNHLYRFQNVRAVRLHLVHRADDHLAGLADILLRAALPISADKGPKIGELKVGRCQQHGDN